MWNLVDDQLPSVSKESSSNEKLSFQSLLSQMLSSSSTRQQDASLSFYFISLLHLANEKVKNISSINDFFSSLYYFYFLFYFTESPY